MENTNIKAVNFGGGAGGGAGAGGGGGGGGGIVRGINNALGKGVKGCTSGRGRGPSGGA
ncbi:hypothetical protein [Photobacterium sanguinicancri]|uniref:hypothetical protein n=1 Tax=Photobacterium sanguinicancri TaxID=875932 RepID=UPI0026E28534|nr:hypothetical protein [Photobacterium sanguinicancri]MDO6498221.1 hypothetical protein [Photobacterium sanguinicancri]